jgi:hypothetical protein
LEAFMQVCACLDLGEELGQGPRAEVVQASSEVVEALARNSRLLSLRPIVVRSDPELLCWALVLRTVALVEGRRSLLLGHGSRRLPVSLGQQPRYVCLDGRVMRSAHPPLADGLNFPVADQFIIGAGAEAEDPLRLGVPDEQRLNVFRHDHVSLSDDCAG